MFSHNNIPMKPTSFSIFLYVIVICCLGLQSRSVNGVDTIGPDQDFADGDTLVSSGQSFELGFFSPAGSTNRYLGIWYIKSPRTVVWVANREIPLADSLGVLTISSRGSLTLLNATKSIIWSSNSSGAAQENMIAQLLDSGNLVLGSKQDLDAKRYVWQSFDSPTDTLLPGMRHGMNLKTGQAWYLTSWKNESDPSVGEFIYRLENLGLPQFVLRQGTEKKYRSGQWNGQRFSGMNTLNLSPAFIPTFVYNDDEMYYTYEMTASSELSKVTMNVSGLVQRSFLNEGDSHSYWTVMYTLPYDLCSEYGKCGPNGFCLINRNPICECLDGFVPKSQSDWDMLSWSSGCKRRIPLDCQKGEGFMRLRNVKLPDLVEFKLNESMSTKECEMECLNNCSCSAFANSNISNGGSGCLMWFGDLTDVREFIVDSDEQDIFLRLAASELRSIRNRRRKRRLLTIAIPIVSVGVLFPCFVVTWCLYRRRNQRTGSRTNLVDIELPLFELEVVSRATENFSFSSVIGEGGFGPVYKGQLSPGAEIAVKRLSKNSGQGTAEFKNEVIMISSLQHRNLVRLLGCCLDGDERMLIYEYMPNGSLDHFLFDQGRKKILTWKIRFKVAMGISRGLLYLHQDSRLRIIHRDLKASNILIDSEMNPKISDFGVAKSFCGDQIEGKTKRVIGTYGYMSPEYAFNGKYSVKSDVFSLGVLFLELVSGRRNRILDSTDQVQSLLGHAWLLWNEDKALELMDDCLRESFVENQVLRCIQVALLCVQKLPEDRPTMASVVLMLSNDAVALPQPKHPGFFVRPSSTSTMFSGTSNEETLSNGSNITITMPEPR